jgi:hypothetical protein
LWQVKLLNAREVSGAGRTDKIRKITLLRRVNSGNKKKLWRISIKEEREAGKAGARCAGFGNAEDEAVYQEMEEAARWEAEVERRARQRARWRQGAYSVSERAWAAAQKKMDASGKGYAQMQKEETLALIKAGKLKGR